MLKRWSALFLSLLFLFIVSMPSAQAKYESENKGQLPSGYWLPIATLTVGQAVVLWENSASVAAWERPDWKWGVGGVVLGLGSLAYVGLVGEDRLALGGERGLGGWVGCEGWLGSSYS